LNGRVSCSWLPICVGIVASLAIPFTRINKPQTWSVAATRALSRGFRPPFHAPHVVTTALPSCYPSIAGKQLAHNPSSWRLSASPLNTISGCHIPTCIYLHSISASRHLRASSEATSSAIPLPNMSITIDKILAANPATTRGQSTQLSCDVKGERIAYAVSRMHGFDLRPPILCRSLGTGTHQPYINQLC
jgi:hypothetical protein